MCMYVCNLLCVYMHVLYACILWVCVYVYMHVYHVCACVYVFMHVHLCIHACTYVPISPTKTFCDNDKEFFIQ